MSLLTKSLMNTLLLFLHTNGSLFKTVKILMHLLRRRQSRFQLLLADYNVVQARLYYTGDLQELPLCLPSLNFYTVKSWLKDDKRQKLIAELVRGLQLPALRSVATTCLPQAKTRPEKPDPPVNPIVMEEPEDRAFMAKVRRGISNAT